MHPLFVGQMALDLAQERTAEAERHARLFRQAGPLPRTLKRGLLARLASSVTSAPGAVARRVGGSVSTLA